MVPVSGVVNGSLIRQATNDNVDVPEAAFGPSEGVTRSARKLHADAL